jgi:hypothetical protein
VLGAPFIGRGRREVSERGRSPVGVEWSPLMVTVLQRGGDEAIDIIGETKRRRQRIDSTARAWRRAVQGGAQRQPKEVAAGRREVEDDRGDGPNGPALQPAWRRVSGQIQGFDWMSFRFDF